MAQIRTFDGEIHEVKETREEIYDIINSPECLEFGVVHLNMRCYISGFAGGIETSRCIYEPVSFMKNGIVMYY